MLNAYLTTSWFNISPSGCVCMEEAQLFLIKYFIRVSESFAIDLYILRISTTTLKLLFLCTFNCVFEWQLRLFLPLKTVDLRNRLLFIIHIDTTICFFGFNRVAKLKVVLPCVSDMFFKTSNCWCVIAIASRFVTKDQNAVS